MNMNKKNWKHRLPLDILVDILGGVSFAVALNCFTSPNGIAPGGVSGVAVMLNHLFSIPLGTTMLVINIPLLILAWFFLGHTFTLFTLKTILIQSVVVDVLALYLPAYQGDHILAALFGGVGMGLGVSLIFRRGSTTGGTDIVSRLIQRRWPFMRIGVVMVGVDALVVATSMIVFRNIETGLYALITIFVSGRVVDAVMGGVNMGRMALIISDQHDEIAKHIISDMHRGVTLLEASGAYSGTARRVLLCAVRISEYPQLQQIVKHHDPQAFLITTNVNEVLGEGFASINDQILS